jgi:glutathione S-transferase
MLITSQIISFVYVLTNPSSWIAVNVIRVSVIARIVHTYSYLNALQPYRAYGFAVCYVAMIYMCIQNALYFF